MNPELHFPWLEFAILLPLLGSILGFLIRDSRASYFSACVSSGLTLVFAVGEWIDFVTLETFRAHDHWDIFLNLFSHEVFTIDELSSPLLPLIALLYFLTLLSTPNSKASRFPFFLVLMSESICLATICCSTMAILVPLLTLSIVPIFVELRARQQPTRVFLIHMGAHVALLFAGWILVEYSSGVMATNIGSLLLLLASILRVGVFPFHLWQLDLFDRCSFGSALLFTAPMIGAYAVMRLVVPIAPTWAMQSIAVLSLVTAVYAGGMSLVQVEMRRFFAYLLLCQSALVLAGLEISNTVGMTGALCVWLSAGASLGGFGLILRVVEARIGRLSMDNFYGLFDHLPLLASLFLITGLSSIGFPGTLGFIGMELLIEGTVEFYPLVGGVVVLTAALSGIAILRAYFRIFTGVRHIGTISLKPRRPERFAAYVLSSIVLGGGLWPAPMVHSRYHAADTLLRLRPSYFEENTPHDANSSSPPTPNDTIED